MMVTQVISGGQTGIDRIALEVATQCGIPTGGTAPRKFMTENGPDDSLKKFGLVENSSPRYPDRTIKNILNSDGTLLLGDMREPGSKLTRDMCMRLSKPVIVNPSYASSILWIHRVGISVLNVAGNRGSKLTVEDVYNYTMFLIKLFKSISDGTI
jgi:hypothetical protein